MVTKIDIDKFDGKISFAIWKVHMQVVLTHHGYKKALRGITHKPQSMSDEDWLELDENALATIQLFLTREVFREVIHETTATGLWLKLESLYMTKSLANKLQLKDRLYTYRKKPEIILYGNRETLSFDDVKSALLSKQKYDDDDVEPESGEGRVARGEVLTEVRVAIEIKNIDHNLVENIQTRVANIARNHIVSDCYKFKNNLEREGKRNNEMKPEKAAEVAIAKGDSDSDVYLAIDTEKSRDELIVDSGCTFHMIPHRSWFTTYELFNGGPLRGFDTFQKRNLISLSTLEANGCKYSGEVYGTAGVATSKVSLDDFKLWHYRLGHMGEKAPNKDQIKELKDQLSNEFDMKDLGPAKRILGMEIRRDQKIGKLTLSQTDYISKVLKKFNMSSCKPVPTPLAPHFKLSSHECPKSEEDKKDMSRVLHSSAVGSLMYAMVCTRPDLAHVVSVTSNIELSFEKGRASPNGVVGYVDFDYAGDLDARKSISSYIFSHCGYAINWHQDNVSQTQMGGSSSQPRTDPALSPINAFTVEELYTLEFSDSLQDNTGYWQAPNPHEYPVEQVATSPKKKKKATRNRQKRTIESDDAPRQIP
nr:retrovirus-related Pol polyprotein from transposon TNT 1-94 [Tanacetum cinerariifolium]